ncbi:MAG: phosphoenolpyruvate synthase [Bacteroidales bacterium]|nr:phosphoenolpyruvate synthase [Bacteroidales bacterium]
MLMQKRIRKVLIISSNYDFFTLEEDGRIDEQIFNEYVSLNLRYPPSFIQANTSKEAFEIMENQDINLVIEMLNIADIDPFNLAKRIKESYNDIPIVVLTHFNREVSLRLEKEDLSAIDYVFCWLGNTDLLLAIIKLIEDKMNADNDIEVIGVQTIMLVEDSIRYTSSYLPELYRIVLQQSREFMKEALNEHQKMLRMRGRPKILLAKTYDEAMQIYQKYSNNMLGIISDVSFKRNNKRDTKHKLGLRLLKEIRKNNPHMPVLLQSSDISNDKLARKYEAGFVHKYSKTLSIDIRNYIISHFGFGEFVFVDSDTGMPIGRASDLQAFQQKILEIPDRVLAYHAEKNDFSKWLNARAIFPVAQLFKYIRKEDFENIDDVRSYIHEAISSFRISKGRGIIAEFDRRTYDEYRTFSRIGQGSIGGKARGLAFIDSVIQKYKLFDKYENVAFTVPRTVVLSTDVFDKFMEMNDLYKIAISDRSDDEILHHFVNARFTGELHQDLYTLLSYVQAPLAIRSSSKLEDSHYQPFAGIYSTYMIPINKADMAHTMEILTMAIKSVYASVYFRSSKAYIAATSNVIDEEKMGIVLQEVCGSVYKNLYYPTISGVARSINFYPIAPEKPEDGIAKIAYGLGKYIVDGGLSLRFSPKHPNNILQLSSPDQALRETQRYFYGLDMDDKSFVASTNDGVNLLRIEVKNIDFDPSLRHLVSVYDYDNDILRDGMQGKGKRLLTFAGVLQHESFPMARILKDLLDIGQKEMNLPIEIEFAVNMSEDKAKRHVFNLLQIRPIVESDQASDIVVGEINDKKTIVSSDAALGNGIFPDIRDIVYINPEKWKASESKLLASEIEVLNAKFRDQKQNYVLIGPGRWGSSDQWLGIPVKWAQISESRVIIESGLENYRIDPSQGTHFFQNLTSFRVGYMTINPYMNDGYYNVDMLTEMPAVFENGMIRHVRFKDPLVIKIDGRSNKGIIALK